MPSNRIRPRAIRLDASTICQLRCVGCPVHSGIDRGVVGIGSLGLADFRQLLQENPGLRHIELANYGEIFMNPDLLRILRYAQERHVALSANDGVNFNAVSNEILEGLVVYGLKSMTCSIDGASDETYALYRQDGSFSTVIQNVRKLNDIKAKYRSTLPSLTWQFVVFGHNEHEIARARELAMGLGMRFRLKLSWNPDFSPVTNAELLEREIGAASREDYRRRFGVDYSVQTCSDLWNSPQINWDGRVLGCSRNFWGDFGANVFQDGLRASVNNSAMRRARHMLLGKEPPRDDIPCATCSLYLDMRNDGKWLDRRQIRAQRRQTNRDTMLDMARKTTIYRGARSVYRSMKPPPAPRLASGVFPLSVPLPPDKKRAWKPYFLFTGSTRALQTLSCHVSVLTQGTLPHPPHTHRQEEILMLLCGEAELVLPNVNSPDGSLLQRLRPGQFVYYPRNFAHSIRATSKDPANYLMFRWSAKPRATASAIGHALYETLEPTASEGAVSGLSSRLVFEGPTQHLRKLHCHSSNLMAGRGYESHVDDYDVAIVVLEGEVETLGERVGPHGVIFYTAGEPHGMHNPGQALARYLVFEFHGHERRSLRSIGKAAFKTAERHMRHPLRTDAPSR